MAYVSCNIFLGDAGAVTDPNGYITEASDDLCMWQDPNDP